MYLLFDVHFPPNPKPCKDKIVSVVTIVFKHLVQLLVHSKYSTNIC